MTTGRGHVLVDEELGPGVRPPLHHQQRLSLLQLALWERRLLARLVPDVDRREADRGVVLKRVPAIRAEMSVARVSMSTVTTDHLHPPMNPSVPERCRPRQAGHCTRASSC